MFLNKINKTQTTVTSRVRVGGLSYLFVRVELGLGRNHGGKFLGGLLLGDGDAGTAQRWSGLHSGCDLSGLLVTVALVPHGSEKEQGNCVQAKGQEMALFQSNRREEC